MYISLPLYHSIALYGFVLGGLGKGNIKLLFRSLIFSLKGIVYLCFHFKNNLSCMALHAISVFDKV